MRTPIEETLEALSDLVRMGKVLYIGVSNLAAWQIEKALGVSDRYGWARFVSVQAYYSIVARDLEVELLPMARKEGLGVLTWSPLAGGYASGKYRFGKPEVARRSTFDVPGVSPRDLRVAETVLARRVAPGERRPGEHAQALLARHRQQLHLEVAGDDRVVGLHADEAGPAVAIADAQRLLDLPGGEIGDSDVEDLAHAHEIAERLERLLDGRARVDAMDLVEVDVVGAEAAQAGIDGLHDVLTPEPHVVDVAGAGRGRVAHRAAELGGDHDGLAGDACGLERPPQDLLGLATRVHVGGVEEVDAGVERGAHQRVGAGLVEHADAHHTMAEGHGTEAELRDAESAGTQVPVFHPITSRGRDHGRPRRSSSLSVRRRFAGPGSQCTGHQVLAGVRLS